MTQLTVLLFLAYVSAHRKGQLCFSPHKGRPERRLSGETPRPWSSRQILLSKSSQSQKLRPVWPHLHGTPKTGTLPETPSRPREGAAADTQGCPLQADGNVPGGFPGSSDGRVSLQCRRPPWVRKIPWRREWLPTPVFLPGDSQGWGRLADYILSECFPKESDTTQQLHIL